MNSIMAVAMTANEVGAPHRKRPHFPRPQAATTKDR
jgi:hypothetical protein